MALFLQLQTVMALIVINSTLEALNQHIPTALVQPQLLMYFLMMKAQ
jgi:hypothetical protein